MVAQVDQLRSLKYGVWTNQYFNHRPVSSGGPSNQFQNILSGFGNTDPFASPLPSSNNSNNTAAPNIAVPPAAQTNSASKETPASQQQQREAANFESFANFDNAHFDTVAGNMTRISSERQKKVHFNSRSFRDADIYD